MKEQFLTYPNLPEGKVTLAAAGDYPEIIEALKKEGIKTVSFESRILPDETKKHTDMLICHIGGEDIFTAPEIDNSVLKETGFSTFTSEEIKGTYPDDVKLNIAVGKDFFAYNPKTADKALINALECRSLKGIKVKQGYSKCSLCFVTENAVITEDPSIYTALKGSRIDVLLISQGDIYLSESHCGFFGGSTGKISPDTLAVTGELKYHRDKEIIEDFCFSHGVKIKELRKGVIVDIGSIIPLLEMR